MDILVLGDTHGNGARMDIAIDVALKYGCKYIYQVGDFGYWPHVDEGVEFLDSLSNALGEVGLKLIFVDGNHENHEALRLETERVELFDTEFVKIRENVLWTGRENVWVHDGVTFAALGGAASIDKAFRTPGYDWFNDEQTMPWEADRLIDRVDGKPVDIMLSHDAPNSIADSLSLMPHKESAANREVIGYAVSTIKPEWFIHGHYHRRVDHEFGGVKCVGLSWDGDTVQNNMMLISLDQVMESRVDSTNTKEEE